MMEEEEWKVENQVEVTNCFKRPKRVITIMEDIDRQWLSYQRS